MKRVTVTIPGDLERALNAYFRQTEFPPGLTTLVQAALREYLGRRGFLAPASPLRITPARHGSGKADVSLRHGEYLAEK